MATTVTADKVRVFFKDGTSTVTYVLDDDSIPDHIVALVEGEGWDMSDVKDYKIIGQVVTEIEEV